MTWYDDMETAINQFDTVPKSEMYDCKMLVSASMHEKLLNLYKKEESEAVSFAGFEIELQQSNLYPVTTDKGIIHGCLMTKDGRILNVIYG